MVYYFIRTVNNSAFITLIIVALWYILYQNATFLSIITSNKLSCMMYAISIYYNCRILIIDLL